MSVVQLLCWPWPAGSAVARGVGRGCRPAGGTYSTHQNSRTNAPNLLLAAPQDERAPRRPPLGVVVFQQKRGRRLQLFCFIRLAAQQEQFVSAGYFAAGRRIKTPSPLVAKERPPPFGIRARPSYHPCLRAARPQTHCLRFAAAAARRHRCSS